MKIPAWRWLLTVVVVATIYFVTGQMGLLVSYKEVNVTLVWPPAGIALGAMLLYGYSVWPGIAVGQLAILITLHSPVEMMLSVPLGNALAAIVGTWLLSQPFVFNKRMDRVYDVLTLIGVGAVFSTAISASIGALSLVLSEVIPWSEFASGGWVMP
jgi:integral membrane sensor domain MASE1